MGALLQIERKLIIALVCIVVSVLISGCATTTPALKQCPVVDDEISQVKTKAENGDPEAQYQIAKWHQLGSCLSQDNAAYKRWLTKAAEQDHTRAQVRLASHYRYDENNLDAAIPLYEKAARKGDIEAQRSLGNIYLKESGDSKDLDAAERWYSMAKDQGDEYSADALEGILKKKNPDKWKQEQRQLASKLELDERAKLEQLLVSAERGDPEAQYRLGKLFEIGTSQVEQNLHSAEMWFKKSADQGFSKAKYAYSWISKVKNSPPSLVGIWRGSWGDVSFNETINIAIKIEAGEGKKYTGHVLQFDEKRIRRTYGIRCKGAEIELSQNSQTRYEIKIVGGSSCNGKGFIDIDSWAGQTKSGSNGGSISFKLKNANFRFSILLDRVYPKEYPEDWPQLTIKSDIENKIEGSYKCQGTSRIFNLSNIVTYSDYPPDCEYLTIVNDKSHMTLKLIDSQGKEVYKNILKSDHDYVVKDGWLKLKPNPFFYIDTYFMARMKATNYFSVTTDGHLVSKLHASATGVTVLIPYFESEVYWSLFQRVE